LQTCDSPIMRPEFQTWPLAPQVTVFYHVFMGSRNLTTSIINEQMLTLHSAPPNSFEVYFTTVGKHWDLASIKASGLDCSTCRHRAHYHEGWEPVTQQSLYEYCMQHPTKQVAYMHSKGSFHSHPDNNVLRRFLMKGIVSQECVNMPATCNVCSSRFSPLPHPHTPGNMWHAKCSHIRRLLPPAVFEQTMNNFFKAHRAAAAWGSSSLEGFGRYAAEHWVHSHPDTEPCDLYAGSYVSLSPIDAPIRDGTWLPQLQIGIRWPLRRYSLWAWRLTPTNMVQWARWRCLEWKTLFNTLPTNFSKWRFEEALHEMAHASLDDAGCSIPRH